MLQAKAISYENQIVTLQLDMSGEVVEVIARFIVETDKVIRVEKPQRLVGVDKGIGMIDMSLTGDSSMVEINLAKVISKSIAKKEMVEEYRKLTSSIIQTQSKLIV